MERVMALVYQWKFQRSFPAQVAGEYLAGLEREHGYLSAEMVLNESRDEKAVLHPLFEWSDERAAEQYRLIQARGIVNNLVVQVEAADGEKPPIIVRAFVETAQEKCTDRGAYKSINIAIRDHAGHVIGAALAELEAFKRKYAAYVELAETVQDVAKAVARLKEQQPAA